MNKREMIDRVASRSTLTKKQTETVISSILDAIIQAVSNGEKVTLSGFGTFESRQRQSRSGRHPQTGHSMEIPSKTVPAFSASKTFKLKVADKLHVLRIPPMHPEAVSNSASSRGDALFKGSIQSLAQGLFKRTK